MKNEAMQNFLVLESLTFQGLAILCLISEGPLHLAAVAKALRVKPPTVTVMVKRLEKLGYAVRGPLDNGRIRMLALTPKGAEVVNKVFPPSKS